MFQKTYLSREMTRAMALDHPIGDPFGGPAYGEKNDPISIVAAVMSIEVGLTIGALTLTGGLMIAGGVLSIAGQVTGNEKLSMIGSIASLAGGAYGAFTDPGGVSGFMDKASAAFNDDIGLSSLWSSPAGSGVTAGAPAQTAMGEGVAGSGIKAGGANPLNVELGSAGSGPATGGSSGGLFGSSSINGGTGLYSGVGGTDGYFGVKAQVGSDFLSPKSGGGLLDSFNKASPLTQMSMVEGVKGLGTGLMGAASGPSDEEQAMLEAKMQADTDLLKSQTDMTSVKAEQLRQEIAITAQKLANKNSTNYKNFVPTVNQNYQSDINRTGTQTVSNYGGAR